MPGICKVGYTDRSVRERLAELNASTSIPKKFVVEYFVQVENGQAYSVEQKAHLILEEKGYHHAKEYFKCPVEQCKSAIAEAIALNNATVLFAKDAEETRQRVLEEQRRKAEEDRRQEEIRIRDAKLLENEQNIHGRYEQRLDAASDPGKFWTWWLGSGLASSLLISMIFPKLKDGGILLGGAFLGLIAGFFLREYRRDKKKQSQKYISLERQRDKELASLKGLTFPSLPSTFLAVAPDKDISVWFRNYFWKLTVGGIILVAIWIVVELNYSKIPAGPSNVPPSNSLVSTFEKHTGEENHNKDNSSPEILSSTTDQVRIASEEEPAAKASINEDYRDQTVLVTELCHYGSGLFSSVVTDCKKLEPPLKDDGPKQWVSSTKYLGEGYECKFYPAHYGRLKNVGSIYHPDRRSCYRTDGQKWSDATNFSK